MRSFHDWMECQQYYSHLKNLIKIKESPSKVISTAKKTKQLNKSICLHKRPFTISSLRKSKNCFALSGKNQSRQQSIAKQNLHIAERLMNTSSVISVHQQFNSYQKVHAIIKKSPSRRRQQKFKEKRLNSFIQIKQNKCIKGLHNYMVSIEFFGIPRVSQSPDNLFWFELILDKQKIKSSYSDSNQVLLEQILFPIKKQLVNNEAILKVHCYRRLQHINLGEYHIQIPDENCQNRLSRVSVDDHRKAIDIKIKLTKIKKKNVKKFFR